MGGATWATTARSFRTGFEEKRPPQFDDIIGEVKINDRLLVDVDHKPPYTILTNNDHLHLVRPGKHRWIAA